jgi:hypothetical protein
VPICDVVPQPNKVLIMSKLALVTPEGLIVSDKQSPKVEVQEVEDDPLHVIAEREAAKQSTQKDTNKRS